MIFADYYIEFMLHFQRKTEKSHHKKWFKMSYIITGRQPDDNEPVTLLRHYIRTETTCSQVIFYLQSAKKEFIP